MLDLQLPADEVPDGARAGGWRVGVRSLCFVSVFANETSGHNRDVVSLFLFLGSATWQVLAEHMNASRVPRSGVDLVLQEVFQCQVSFHAVLTSHFACGKMKKAGDLLKSMVVRQLIPSRSCWGEDSERIHTHGSR